MDDLALQVGLVDLVELGDAERADAGRGQVEQRRAAQAAGADDEHLGVLQPLLPGHPDVGDDQVPAVAAYLVDGQLGGGLHEREREWTRMLLRSDGVWLVANAAEQRWPGSRPCSPRPQRHAARRDTSRHPVTADPSG